MALAPPRADAVRSYADSVLRGDVLTCEYVKLAAKRHLLDLERTDLVWNQRAADHALEFFPRFLRLAEGRHAGQPFVLEPIQEFIVGSLFGWYMPDSTRRFRVAYIEMAKGNGKTPLAAGIGLYGMMADDEASAEIYCAGVTRDQANYILTDAKKMGEASPDLRKRLDIQAHNLAVLETNSYMRGVSSEARSLDQKRVHMALIDEIHEHPNDLVVQKMTAGTKGRENPLIIEITNAGYDRHSICWAHHQNSEAILKGTIQNDEWFALMTGLDEGDDWADPAVWPKANPLMGVSVTERYLKGQIQSALDMPANINIVKRLNLCVWTDASRGAIDLAKWDVGAVPLHLEPGATVYGGLDLAATTDLTAFVLLRQDEAGWLDVRAEFWCPEEGIELRSRRDHVPYREWADEGWIIPTPGNITDYDRVRADVMDMAELYDVAEIGYDRWNATQLVTQLTGDGATMVPVGQGYASMTAPTKEFLGAVTAGKIRHGGNPVLRWMASNLVVETDPAGNMKPSKVRSTERIDGMVAAILAQSRISAPHEEEFVSVYEQRGRLLG
jgi:phage terminase large subunit-like protein